MKDNIAQMLHCGLTGGPAGSRYLTVLFTSAKPGKPYIERQI